MGDITLFHAYASREVIRISDTALLHTTGLYFVNE